MTVRFRNPWVDPRVLSVRPSAAVAYLRDHGWHEAESAVPGARRFLSPVRGESREAVVVPAATDDEALANLLVECIGRVAAWEGRYAGDLLNELLGGSAGAHANGAAHDHPAGTTG